MDWDWVLELRIGFGNWDWGFGLGIGIGDWDWELRLGAWDLNQELGLSNGIIDEEH